MTLNEAIARASWPLDPARAEDWDAIYADQLPRVYNYFRFRVGDGPVAEDLASITFEKAWRARARFRRDRAGFGTWLLAIARNVAIDHFRARRVHEPLATAERAPGGADPSELTERRAEFERLGRLLERLPERDRDLIALKFGAGWTNRAIAKAVRLSESNVGTLLHRATRALRAGWEEGAS